MSRVVRFQEPPQPPLPLGHGAVHWDTLPPPVRARVLALWMQLLAEHLSHDVEWSNTASLPGPAGIAEEAGR
jgi:hypothetical protein